LPLLFIVLGVLATVPAQASFSVSPHATRGDFEAFHRRLSSDAYFYPRHSAAPLGLIGFEVYADATYEDKFDDQSFNQTAVDGDYTGVLVVHSLSKRSNLAGYRAGFVAGDPALVGELLAVRKHAGMIVPEPVQAAMVAALGDESHVAAQRARYAARRDTLRAAVLGAGFTVESSTAGLYLWVTRGDDCWSLVDWFADRGILVAPGDFYGPAGRPYVRLALTATDERIAAAAARLG
jgi:aspartate/methionine/tyrosine aminotransferase